MTATWRRVLLVGGLAVWLIGVATTFVLVWRYKMTPGVLGAAPAHWPRDSTLRHTPGVPNLVMFAHPQCPCTRASMTELARLADELHGQARLHVVLVRPEGAGPDFDEGVVADRAATIPGVVVSVDIGGHEAQRFGAVVSGTTVLYGRDGQLLFHGGLTTARGHEGRGPAHDRIIALVHGGVPDREDAPAFGCALAVDPDDVKKPMGTP